MKMSKIEGLKMLDILDLPTIQQINPNLLDENSQVLKQGVSVRTSPKVDKSDNVYLPSIHNCTDLNKIREFIKENREEYNIIVHRTVKPELIGSISRYEAGIDKLVIEMFKDFEQRKKGIIENRVIVPIMSEKFMISQLEMKNKDAEEYKIFCQIIKDVNYMPFKKFDSEFIVENGKILYTDLTINGREDNEYAKELRKGLHKKSKGKIEIGEK